MTKRGKYVILCPERFIKIWQKAKCADEVHKEYGEGMTKRKAVSAAANLRKNGVPLKKLNRGGIGRTKARDYKALAKLAGSLLK